MYPSTVPIHFSISEQKCICSLASLKFFILFINHLVLKTLVCAFEETCQPWVFGPSCILVPLVPKFQPRKKERRINVF